MLRRILAGIYEEIWRLLPDRCEVEGCERRGVRGNENVVDGRVMCDYCHVRLLADAHPWIDRCRG